MKFHRPLIVTALIMPAAATLSVASLPAQAAEMTDSAIAEAVDAGFTELERQMVEKYYGEMPAATETEDAIEIEQDAGGKGGKGNKYAGKKEKGLPPGLAKRQGLPPGLAKRETLPPGLEKRALPADLEEQLPPPPAGYDRQIVGDSAVVLIDRATGKVVDIIKDILIPGADD